MAPVIRKKTKKKRVCRTFCGFDVGIEATKGLPLPNDLSVFVSRLIHRRDPRETELLLSLSLSLPLSLSRSVSLSLARAFALFSLDSFSLFLFRPVADGRLHTRCFHSLPFRHGGKTPVKNLPPASLF